MNERKVKTSIEKTVKFCSEGNKRNRVIFEWIYEVKEAIFFSFNMRLIACLYDDEN